MPNASRRRSRARPRCLSRPDLAALAACALLAWAQPAAANRADLAAFLERTEKMYEFPSAARADVTLRSADGKIDQALLIFDPATAHALMVVKSSGLRVLASLDWRDATVAKGTGAKPEPIGADEPLQGTDLRVMEFFPFWKTDYSTAFVSDTNRSEKVVSLYAAKGVPYTLFVISFDKAKLVPLSTKYYRDTMSNLVRVRKDSDHVMVGSRPRPRRIEITDYTQNRTTTLELDWLALEHAPGDLMDPATFADAAITWPEVAASAASPDPQRALPPATR